MNLGDLWLDDDADDAAVWAVHREFELRDRRYRFYLEGGIAGVIKRVIPPMQSLARVLQGVDADR